jgi:hypothetical protein
VERHVTILAILTNIWGLLAIVVGVSLLFLSSGALASFTAAQRETVGLAAGFFAGAFALIGAFELVWGAAHVWSAMLLRRRHPWGRALSLGLAVVNLVLLPFGTAFGIYALWVLLTNEGRRLFEPTASLSAHA